MTGQSPAVVSASKLGLTFQTNDGPVEALSNVNLTIGKGVLELMVAEGVEPRLGARRMRTTVETHCRHAVREAMLSGQRTSGELVQINGKLVIQN